MCTFIDVKLPMMFATKGKMECQTFPFVILTPSIQVTFHFSCVFRNPFHPDPLVFSSVLLEVLDDGRVWICPYHQRLFAWYH